MQSILGIVTVAQKPAAGAKKHRAMPAHEESESALIATNEKRLQKLAIGEVAGALQSAGSLQEAENVGKGSLGHVRMPSV